MKQPPAKLKLRMMKEAKENLQNMQEKGICVDSMLADIEKKLKHYGKLAKYQKKMRFRP